MTSCVGNTGLIVKVGDALLRSCPSQGKGIHRLTEEIGIVTQFLLDYIPSNENAKEVSAKIDSAYDIILANYNVDDFEAPQDLRPLM